MTKLESILRKLSIWLQYYYKFDLELNLSEKEFLEQKGLNVSEKVIPGFFSRRNSKVWNNDSTSVYQISSQVGNQFVLQKKNVPHSSINVNIKSICNYKTIDDNQMKLEFEVIGINLISVLISAFFLMFLVPMTIASFFDPKAIFVLAFMVFMVFTIIKSKDKIIELIHEKDLLIREFAYWELQAIKKRENV